MRSKTPEIFVLAGPNGAGKSSVYRLLVADETSAPFINADNIQRDELDDQSPEGSYLAARIAAERRDDFLRRGEDFVTETVFSHPSKLELIEKAKSRGFKLHLYHVDVESSDVSVDRVGKRAAFGGHDVPEEKIRDRYVRNKDLIREAVLSSDVGLIIDNSTYGQKPKAILRFEDGKVIRVGEDVPGWIQKLYGDEIMNFEASKVSELSDGRKAVGTQMDVGDEQAKLKAQHTAIEEGLALPARNDDYWFDLSGINAKLSRFPADDMGEAYTLHLEMDTDAFDAAVAQDVERDIYYNGWIKDDAASTDTRVVLITHQSSTSAREVASRLSGIVPFDDLVAMNKPISEHANSPEVFGLRKAEGARTLKQLVAGVEVTDLARITNTLEVASLRSEQLQEKAASVLFAGQGNRVFNHLTDHLMNRAENPWPELEAASYARSRMEAAGLYDPKGSAAAQTDQNALLMNDLGAALRDGDQEAVEELTITLTHPTSETPGDQARENSFVDPRVVQCVEMNLEMSRSSGNDVSARQIALAMVEGADRLPAAAMVGNDGVTRQNAAKLAEQARESLPFDVHEDASTPTIQVARSLIAIDKATKASIEAMGVSSETLLHPDSPVALRVANSRTSFDHGVIGKLSTLQGEDGKTYNEISTSATSGRSFIHELGHAVDSSWGFTDDERRRCIQASGVYGDLLSEVDQRFPMEEGGFDGRAYYQMDQEVFARMFDAHVCNVARENGDMTLESIGGAHVTAGYDKATVHGDLEASSRFMREVSSVVEQKRSAERTNEKTVDKTAETSRDADSGMAPR